MVLFDMEIDKKKIAHFHLRVEDAAAFLNIKQKEETLRDLEDQIAVPGFWDDSTHAQQVSKEASYVRDIIDRYNVARDMLENLDVASSLAEYDDSFSGDVQVLANSLSSLLNELEIESWFSGRFDDGSAIVSINPGQGGLEANDWTDMLFKMYTRYCESKGWKVQVLDISQAEVIGIDHVTFQVEGKLAYGMLSSEAGVHRLVRISPTDEKKRRHTTFAGVEVLPVLPDDVEVNLDMNEVRVDVFRSSGPGGQCVNTTDSAVRLTHIPSGIAVTCQNQKSQLQNKEAALRVLKAKLYEREEQKRREAIEELRGQKLDNSFGSQIRNYVLYPYQLVKDLRSGYETGNVEGVLNGEIDDVIVEFHKWRSSQDD